MPRIPPSLEPSSFVPIRFPGPFKEYRLQVEKLPERLWAPGLSTPVLSARNAFLGLFAWMNCIHSATCSLNSIFGYALMPSGEMCLGIRRA